MTVGELIKELERRPDDSAVLAILPKDEYPMMVAGVDDYLNPAGRVVVHLGLFDYRRSQ